MRAKFNYRLSVVMTLAFWLIVSCQNENLVKPDRPLPVNKGEMNDSTEIGMIQLGDQLENPYSIENMERARGNILVTDPTSTLASIQIEPTHYYVKFSPANEEELDILTSDSTLIIYDYPLDYEILEGGDYYREPGLPEDLLRYMLR